MILEQTKKCGKCKKRKPLSQFFANRSRPDGYGNRCKECAKNHTRASNAACEVCGSSYYAKNKSSSKYCSKECTAKARDKKIDTVCKKCGKSFQVHQYKIGSNFGKYCSRTCAMSARSGEKCASWKGGHVATVCTQCGSEFEVRQYRKNISKFCSLKCKGDWQSEKVRGKKHPAWRGGSGNKGYPPHWNEKFKKTIRQRDNYTCALCGNYGKQVHHIDYVKQNTTPENCITLCRSCHTKTNFNRDEWLPVFREIIDQRNNL